MRLPTLFVARQVDEAAVLRSDGTNGVHSSGPKHQEANSLCRIMSEPTFGLEQSSVCVVDEQGSIVRAARSRRRDDGSGQAVKCKGASKR